MGRLGLMRWGAREAVRAVGFGGLATVAVLSAALVGLGSWMARARQGELDPGFWIFSEGVLSVLVFGLAAPSGAALPDARSRGWAAWGGAITRLAMAEVTALGLLALDHRSSVELWPAALLLAMGVQVTAALRHLLRSPLLAGALALPSLYLLVFGVEMGLMRLYDLNAGRHGLSVCAALATGLLALACWLRPPDAGAAP